MNEYGRGAGIGAFSPWQGHPPRVHRVGDWEREARAAAVAHVDGPLSDPTVVCLSLCGAASMELWHRCTP